MGLTYDAEVQSFVRTLAPAPKRAIRLTIDLLKDDPYAETIDWKALDLEGEIRLYRARVGVYRIVYSIRGRDLHIHKIMHRRDGYGWLSRFD